MSNNVMESRLMLVQQAIDRLVPKHDKSSEFEDELKALVDKYPLNYEVKYFGTDLVDDKVVEE